MTATISQALATPPTPPDPTSDSDTAFSNKALAFTLWMTLFGTQLNTWTLQANQLAADLNSVNGVAMRFTYDGTSTVDGDPGNGKMRFSSLTQNAATVLRLDLLDFNSVNTGPLIDLFDDSSSVVKGLLGIRHGTDLTKYLIFEVTAVASPSGYKNVTVNNVASSSASPFTNGDPVVVSFTRNGDIATGTVTSQQIQNQTFEAVTTAGTSTAYTLTPSPANAGYAANQSYFVNFHAACGAAPTLNISGLGATINLVKQLADGTYANLAAGDVPINHRSRVTLLSTTQALVERGSWAGGAVAAAAYTTPVSVAFSATPTFDASKSNVFYLGSMTANVTAITISNPSDGQTINIRCPQDSTGGRTVTPGSSVRIAGTQGTAANGVAWMCLTYVLSATKWEGSWMTLP